jgi:glycosyltransferase involved in cell wall biosynthesis
MRNVVPVILLKNDCWWLPYTLESIRGSFQRYVIYDVGSKDGTQNIIDWFVETEKSKAEFYIRKLPHCDPEIQGIFRNSMISESQSEWYFIVDGDELYDTFSIRTLENYEDTINGWLLSERKILYGVFKRVEVSKDLTARYDRERSHHRIYHRTAIWKGTHPGEEAVIRQSESTEEWLPGVKTWHFHNAMRSPLESDVPSRMRRKNQQTYHPGNLVNFDILKELPLLRKPINNFEVCPDLKKLQDAIN